MEELLSLAQSLYLEYEKLEKYPQSSFPYKKALNSFLIYCQRLPHLLRDSHPDYPLAKNLTWEWLSKHIQDFKSPISTTNEELSKEFLEQFIKALTTWINAYLYWRIRDLYLNSSNPQPFPIDGVNPITGTPFVDSLITPLLNGFSWLEQQTRLEQIIEMIIYCLTDPKGELKAIHPANYPQVNCWLLSQRLVFKEILANLPEEMQDKVAHRFDLSSLLNSPDATYTTLASEFNIPYQNLNSHWKRKGIPLLKTIASRYFIDNF
jgi:hypothetical protein